MSLGQRMIQRHKLDHQQKLQLSTLLELSQKLKHPEFPNAVQGLEGLRVSDKVLKEKNSAGLLIGGLSERVWNYRTKPNDLNKSKDVDVLVLNKEFEVEPFEYGIDWWLPKSANIKIISDASSYNKNQTWYENGNDAFLYFGVREYHQLSPGLYIPSRNFIINMRQNEAIASMSRKSFVETDDDVFDKFYETFNKKLGTKVAGFIPKEFNILDVNYINPFTLEEFDNEIIVGINRYKRD